jgi:methionyl-tRNA synthetase
MDISFDHFKTMDLRVGEIKTVEDIEGADRIYKIGVDIGEERTIIAGIKAFYSKEDLIGKKVVVLANLEPKTIRGNESQGMLLAAVKEDPRTLTVLTIDKDMPNGSRVS